jgi:hypothetical protein
MTTKTLRLLLLLALVPGAPAQAQNDDPMVRQCSAQHPVGVARADCLAPWLEELVVRQGSAAAMQAVLGLVKSGVMDDCHVMSHTVGHATWRKSRDLRKAFGACSSACVQGCWHGVMEASMMESPQERITSKQALAFCDALGQGSLERRQCLHGVGHGIMHQRRDALSAAVTECEALGGRYESAQCLGGMWMQWTHFPLHEGVDSFRKKAPELCAAVRQDLSGQCALAVGGAAMFATAHDAERSKSICRQMPSGQQRQCLKGVQHEIDVLRVHGPGHAHQH